MLVIRTRFSSPNTACAAQTRTSIFTFQVKPTKIPKNNKLSSLSFSTLKDFPQDSKFNVSSNVAEKIGKNIYLNKGHPLNTIKEKMENYWKSVPQPKFNTFDSIPPFASVERNFDRLLFPSDHVGRSSTDTYYVNESTVLRTHTTAHQTELIEKGNKAIIVSGDVYRRDAIDATHYPVFHQMDGVCLFKKEELQEPHDEFIEKDMKNHLEQMVFAVFGQKLESRWVDGYFPFTNPSWELEIYWNGQWLEVLGCGVIRQEILEKCGVGETKGWAFGIGLERLAMVLFKIPDIRLFWSNDQRFLSQFSAGKITHFKAFSSYPPCLKDITFWVPPTFHENDFCEFVRGQAGDLVENVTCIDSFKHPKTGRESRCYRLTYRSMERNLTNEEIDVIQNKIRTEVPKVLQVELR